MNYSGPVVFFDGVCNLCNGAVQFIIRKDKKGLFRFASLQSAAGRDAIAQTGTAGTEGAEGSIILRYKGKYYVRSSAALKIAALMGGLMWLLLPGYLL
ncbi:MAG: DUF393 domain-containing protein, partial [Flavipsychrobacter sp.]|nr:DUF393 domain-containing protein [Flavipsychrobacter sp.]